MSIRFKDKNEGTSTKEEMKLHIIENRFKNYTNHDLSDSMINGDFNKIYKGIIARVFN